MKIMKKNENEEGEKEEIIIQREVERTEVRRSRREPKLKICHFYNSVQSEAKDVEGPRTLEEALSD